MIILDDSLIKNEYYETQNTTSTILRYKETKIKTTYQCNYKDEHNFQPVDIYKHCEDWRCDLIDKKEYENLGE